MNNILTITDWNNYIYKKKLDLIDTINNDNKLNNTPDSFKFNDILKHKIIKINIFNMSYIAFMMLKFLETSFIPSEILLNIINKYNDDELYRLLIINRKIIKQTNKNYKLETYKYIKILKYIITIIIDFVVKIELSLNIQCLLMTHFIDKIHTNKTTGATTSSTTTNSTSHRSTIFTLFSSINEDVINTIKSSTLILLFLKLISKFNTNYDETNLLYFINEHESHNFTSFINNKKTINKKTKLYLDYFMLDITNYFLIENSIYSIHTTTIYSICNKYMLNTIELIFNSFENIYDILANHLLQSININEHKKIKLTYLKNVIKNIVDIEIVKIKKLFYT